MGDENDKPKGLLVSGQEGLELILQALLVFWGFTMGPPVAALLAILAPFVSLVGSRILERHADALKGYVRSFGGSRRKARDHSRRHRSDPSHRDTLYWLFRMMQDAVDPSVVETLGHLAGTYASKNRRPDDFFRGMGRLLCDLEPGEIHDLRAMLTKTRDRLSTFDGSLLRLSLDEDPEEREGDHQVNLYLDGAEVPLLRLPTAVRLFALMRREGIADGLPRARGMRSDQGDHVMRLPVRKLHAMLEVIDPPARGEGLLQGAS